MITAEYRDMNRRMHEVDPNYGCMGRRYTDMIIASARMLEARSILDYGCGKSTLRASMPEWPDFREYDPAVPGKDGRPEPADLVTCTDVMEHIEPEFLRAVMDDIERVAVRGVFFVIATVPAQRLLPDGTNPHKIIQDESWWLPLLMDRWRLKAFEANPKRFFAVMQVRT